MGESKVGAVVDGAEPEAIGEALGAFAVAGVKLHMSKGIAGDPSGPVRYLKDTGHLREQITAKPEGD